MARVLCKNHPSEKVKNVIKSRIGIAKRMYQGVNGCNGNGNDINGKIALLMNSRSEKMRIKNQSVLL